MATTEPDAAGSGDAATRGPPTGGDDQAVRPTPRGWVGGLVVACRPRQWVKNLLVFAAPLTAGAVTQPRLLALAGLAFVLFCLAASATYLFNDIRDAPADRRHDHKRHRPVASGVVPVPLAAATGVVLVVVALGGAAALATPAGRDLAGPAGGVALLLVLASYLTLTTLYTVWLKKLVVSDIVAVAGCHLLRALAGAVAVGVPVTSWFLIVVSFGALLVVVGKREAELRNPGSGNGRTALASYSVDYLAQIRTMASAAMAVTYCLWALEEQAGATMSFHGAGTIPFVMAVLRYNLLVHNGAGEDPTELALRDRALQLYLVALIVLVGLGIYVA